MPEQADRNTGSKEEPGKNLPGKQLGESIDGAMGAVLAVLAQRASSFCPKCTLSLPRAMSLDMLQWQNLIESATRWRQHGPQIDAGGNVDDTLNVIKLLASASDIGIISRLRGP